ncbi:MAG: hypothetical protein ASARMPREDX12_007516 [Alectoria sarmentosa]|nr:MAG: hypothetical protein ASARMPREDX12_007516 [Alectoria sarmentosa]CAD6566691.1 MAG: hypothetical protein ASARMPRED_000110 [Alectoria sarmentosa]
MPPRQTFNSRAYTPSPSTSPQRSPISPTPTSVDVTYQVVRIKPTETDWLTPNPSDLIQIIGPVSGASTPVPDNEEAAEDDGFEIQCAARLTWGDKSIYLTCLYYPSASLFMGFRGCADKTVNAVDEAEPVKSVGVTMQDAIFSEEETEGEMVEDEDMRDDGGNPFMVLHVNKGLGGSVRLYCKKVTDSQNRLTERVGEILGLDKSGNEMDDDADVVGRRSQKIIL